MGKNYIDDKHFCVRCLVQSNVLCKLAISSRNCVAVLALVEIQEPRSH